MAESSRPSARRPLRSASSRRLARDSEPWGRDPRPTLLGNRGRDRDASASWSGRRWLSAAGRLRWACRSTGCGGRLPGLHQARWDLVLRGRPWGRPGGRLAARHYGRLRLYEANDAVGARTGADLLDLAGKVRYLSVNSGRVELARIKDRGRVAELVRSVLEAPVGPTRGRAEDRYCFVVFNMVDRTAVRRAFFPETGELMPGVFASREFSTAVERALRGRQERCGRGA